MFGDYPVHDDWDGSGWEKAQPTNIINDQLSNAVFSIGLNNYDFPVLLIYLLKLLLI